MVEVERTHGFGKFSDIAADAGQMARFLSVAMNSKNSNDNKALEEAAASLIGRSPKLLYFPYVLARVGHREEEMFFRVVRQAVNDQPACGALKMPELREVEVLWTQMADMPQVQFDLFSGLLRNLAKEETRNQTLIELCSPESKLIEVLDPKYRHVLCAALLFEFRVNADNAEKHLSAAIRCGITPTDLLKYAAPIPSPSHFPAALIACERHAIATGAELGSEAIHSIKTYLTGRLSDLPRLAEVVQGYVTSKLGSSAVGTVIGEACKDLNPMAKLLVNLIFNKADGVAARLAFAIDAEATNPSERKPSDAMCYCMLRALAVVFDGGDLGHAGMVISAIKSSALAARLSDPAVLNTCPEFAAAKERLLKSLPEGVPAHNLRDFLRY